MCFSEKEKGQNTKQSCYRFILCPLLYSAFPSLFGNLKRLRIGSVIFFTVGYFRFNLIRSLFVYLSNGAALYVAPRTFHSTNSVSVTLSSVSLQFFPFSCQFQNSCHYRFKENTPFIVWQYRYVGRPDSNDFEFCFQHVYHLLALDFLRGRKIPLTI